MTFPSSWSPVTGVARWHGGLTVRETVVSVQADFLALDVEFVATKIIRALSGGHEDDLITSYIKAATELAEHEMQIHITPKRLALVTDGMPTLGVFELPGRPVRNVLSVDYYDGDDALQTLGGSPAPWITVSGGLELPTTVQPLVGASWPTPAARPDAVTLTYDVGYATPAEIPHLIRTGIGLVACELYKNADLSNDQGQEPNVLGLSRFFPRRW